MNIKFIATLTIVIMSIFTQALAGDYPKTQMEREQEEMGSVIGGQGLLFKPGRIKNESTKAKIGNVNKYLYQSSLHELKSFPIESANSSAGAIITDWYILESGSKSKEKTQVKIMVYIKDDIICTEGLEVIAFERKKENGEWSNAKRSASIASDLEEKIIRNARELYLKSEK